MATRKGLGQANVLRTNNNTSTGYGVVYADEVSGHRTVGNLTALYALNDWQLSASGDNTNSDAVGQLWYVVDADGNGNGCYYQLKDWSKRKEAAGWSEFKGTGASTAAAVTFDNTASGMTAANAQGAIEELNVKKLAKADIVQEPGNSEELVMSQKAVSDKLNGLSTEIIYDVSAHNDGVVFESLQALLSSSNLNTLIPPSVRHGGMSIKFIQGSEQSSDNRYVRFDLIADEFTTDVSQWQGVDKVPKKGSHNLIESGAVADKPDVLDILEEGYYIANKQGKAILRIDKLDTKNIGDNLKNIILGLIPDISENLLEETFDDGFYISNENGECIFTYKNGELNLIEPIHVFLPKDIYVAVGRTIELYKNQICLEADRYNFQFECVDGNENAIGKHMERKFVIEGTQQTIGTYVLKCNIFNNNMKKVWSGTSSVHVVSDTISTSKTVCAIGDSLTNNKPWLAEVNNLSNGNVSFVGTRELSVQDSDGNLVTGGQEGRSGFKAASYILGLPYTYGGANETPHNRFWNDVLGRFDWSYYKTTYTITCDYVVIFLGTNAITGGNLAMEVNTEASYLKQMVDYILQDEPNKHIFICEPPYFGNQNGMGNQSATDGYASGKERWQKKMWLGVMMLIKKYEEIFADYPTVHLVPLATTHDSEYNYGNMEVHVNPRAIQVEYISSESAHPQNQGYYQIADTIFSAVCGLVNN